jgi:exopolysaccharide biosynthesis polyprenyl glycosylphosphotransferase
MLKAQRTASIILMMALDAVALVLAFFVAWQMRASLGEFIAGVGKAFGYTTAGWVRRGKPDEGIVSIIMSPNPMVNISAHLWVLYFSLLSWGALLYFQKGYDLGARRNARQEFALCAYTGILATISLLAFMGLLHWETSRLFIVSLLLIGVLVLWGARTIVVPLAQKASKPRRNVLIIGPTSVVEQHAKMLLMPAYQWSRLVGYISEEAAADVEVPYLGTLADLPNVLHRTIVDEVVLVRSIMEQGVKSGEVLELCLEQGRTISLVDDLAPPVNAKVEAGMMGQMPVLTLHNTPQNPLALTIKQIMDRTLAAFALFVLTFVLPVFPIVAFLIWKNDRGPIFYSQERVGLNGRIFKFYKFRSMHIDASNILETLKRENRAEYDAINIMQEPFFKAPDDKDPRITPVGRFIRKYSIDELPQFWNVLKGDMSLVGPRPPLPKEVAELAPWQRRKLSVKGGLTCIWQATGRNDITSTDEWMRMDLEYIDNWSLWLDVKLLFMTVKSVVKARGAS